LRASLDKRDTVRKVLRWGVTEFVYKREVQPQHKLGGWIETLTAILKAQGDGACEDCVRLCSLEFFIASFRILPGNCPFLFDLIECQTSLPGQCVRPAHNAVDHHLDRLIDIQSKVDPPFFRLFSEHVNGAFP
jgi:hypothetical protein